MKRPKRRRPRPKEISTLPDNVDLGDLAKQVSYIGSPEHKSARSFAGMPRPRSDATLCSPDLGSASKLTGWLRKAVRAGQVGAPWEGGFPRYAWFRRGDEQFEARLVNRGTGEYKGYPITPPELPPSMR
jgi:hypothetical protein